METQSEINFRQEVEAKMLAIRHKYKHEFDTAKQSGKDVIICEEHIVTKKGTSFTKVTHVTPGGDFIETTTRDYLSIVVQRLESELAEALVTVCKLRFERNEYARLTKEAEETITRLTTMLKRHNVGTLINQAVPTKSTRRRAKNCLSKMEKETQEFRTLRNWGASKGGRVWWDVLQSQVWIDWSYLSSKIRVLQYDINFIHLLPNPAAERKRIQYEIDSLYVDYAIAREALLSSPEWQAWRAANPKLLLTEL